MSQENVEVLRRAVDAFNRGGIRAIREFADPAMEFREPPEQPAPRVARGFEEVVEMWSEFDSAWESHQSEVEELRAIDTDKVLVVSVEHFVGRDGMKVDAPASALATFRDGRIVLWEAFWDRRRALEAAGLAE